MERKYKIILITLISAIFIANIDAGIIIPGRLTIATSLGVSNGQSVWIMSAFTLSVATSMLVLGVLAQKFGKKKILMLSIGLFTLSSFICGITNVFHSYPILIGARIVQGFFGGGLVPITASYIGSEFPEKYRSIATGYVGTTYATGNVLGPLFGSIILDLFGKANWGWLFYVNIIFGCISLFLAYKYLDESKRDSSLKVEPLSISFVSLSVLCICLFFSNLDVLHFWNSIMSIGVGLPFVLSIVFGLIGNFFIDKLKGPLVVLKTLFKDVNFCIAVLTTTLGGLAIFTFSVYFPQVIEHILHLQSGKGGYYLIIIGITGILVGPTFSKILNRFELSTTLRLLCFGVIVGFLFLIGSIWTSSLALMVIAMVLYGYGQNVVMVTIPSYIVQMRISSDLQGQAQSMLALSRALFLTICPVIGVVFLHLGEGLSKSKSVSINFGFTFMTLFSILLLVLISLISFKLRNRNK